MKRYILILMIAVVQMTIHAQDIHFSQFSETPLFINPALTGAFNGDQRVILNHRSQWKDFNASFRTSCFSADALMMKKKWKKSNLGLGLTFFNDKAGDMELGMTQVNLSIASHITLNSQNQFSAGIQTGFGQQSIDLSGAKWANQYINFSHDPAAATYEPAYSENHSFIDMSTGVLWSFSLSNSDNNNSQVRINTGASLFHLNKPKKYFFSDYNLNQKLIIHSGANIGISYTSYSLKPSVLYMSQGALSEFTFGTMFKHAVNEGSRYTNFVKDIAVLIGGYYRTGDSFIMRLAVERSYFTIGLSYDIGLSDLARNASGGAGATEISIKFTNPNPFGNRSANVKFL